MNVLSTLKSNRSSWILIGISIASFMGCIDFTIVNTALPAIKIAFKTDMSTLQWIINGFILALSAFMVLAGRIADHYGRRKVLYLGMVLFGLASLGAGLSHTMLELIVFRLIQGLSCSILYTATGAILSNAFPPNARGRAMGILFGVNALGLALGPVLGGFIVGALSWRWIFFVNIPLVLISLLICIPTVQESRSIEASKPIDYWGAFLLIIGLSALVITFTQANSWGWGSPWILVSVLTTITGLSLFYAVEKKVADPIINFILFKNKSFITSIIATFSLAFFYCVAFFLMPLYLQNIRGESDYVVGLMLLPVTGTIALVSPLIGRYVDKKGAVGPLVIGFICFTLSAIFQANFTEASHLGHVLVAFILMGIGWACILGPSTVLALSSLPETKAGLGMGASWTFHNIGGVVGLGLGLALYYDAFNRTHQFMAGFQQVMILLGGLSLLTCIAILYLSSKSRSK